MKNKEKKILIILIVVLILLDQIFKIIFLASNLKIGNVSGFSLGITQNIKSQNNIQYILISIIAILALVRYITRNNMFIKLDSKIIISFAIAGCFSNLLDRIWNGAVINYINIPNFTSLNLAYFYILVTWIGMAAVLTKYTSERIKERKNDNKKEI